MDVPNSESTTPLDRESGMPVHDRPDVRRRHILTLGVALILLLIVIAGAGYWALAKVLYTQVSDMVPTDLPHGNLVVSLISGPIEPTGRGIITMTYDISDHDLQLFPPSTIGTEYQYKLPSPDSIGLVTYVRANTNLATSSITQFNVYRTSILEVPWNQFGKVLHDGVELTNDDTQQNLYPMISDAGDVVFMTRPLADSAGITQANSWRIEYVSAAGQHKTIDQGIYPRWAGNGRIVYLKNDGLYLYTLSTQTEKRIWSSSGLVTTAMMLDVSKDGKYIVWSVPSEGKVYVFRVLNDGTYDIGEAGSVDTRAWSPAISADDTFVAVASEQHNDDNTTTPIIQYIDLSAMHIVDSLTIDMRGWYAVAYRESDPSVFLDRKAPTFDAATTTPPLTPDYILLNDWWSVSRPRSHPLATTSMQTLQQQQ